MTRAAVLAIGLSLFLPAAARAEPEDLLSGALPAQAPEVEVMRSRCMVCHGLEYVTQQRLTLPQWEKTIAKMKKWGAAIGEEEAKALAQFAAARWTPELPERRSPRVPKPPEALPAKP